MKFLALLFLAATLVSNAQEYTRGIGVYPGDPNEYAGPTLVVDATTYRNLALHRPAYQSSAYDYNLTAQLVTDGIKETRAPAMDRHLHQRRRHPSENRARGFSRRQRHLVHRCYGR